MIAILTDKPNVGKEIARILGAHTREDGYMSGNGYMVTWTFGNMLSLAMPKDYGMDRPERGDFPINPAPFRLMVKHIRTDTGWIPDINAVLQLKVIEKVFDACESIIAATDASREGEMVFRYLYRYLECRKPYRRLWISSLTDEAVLEGMGSRYRERENHIATDTFPVFISLCKNNTLLKMRCTEEFTDREAAARLYSDCKLAGHARVTAVSRQIREIEPPALYNLTELQKDANNYYGMTAGKSLEIAQRLYEKKLISYPRTAGRFLPRDVYDKLPRIMEKILNRKEFRPYVRSMGINIFDLPDKVVDEGQAAEHHAIIITDTYPEGLNREEMQLYMMIIGRMLEAFMPTCRAEYTTVDAVCAARNFRCHACRIIEKGWFGIFERESVIAGREYGLSPIPQLENGETAAVTGCSLIHRKDLPVSAYTDAELITYMDTAGLGTPATRTGILQTLIDRKYVRYSGKYIIPTRKGLYIYETVRNMKIAGTALTSGWEAQLARMERGKLTQEEFMKGVLKLSGEVTEDIFRKCER